MPPTSTTAEQASSPPPSAHTASTGSTRPESTLPPAASYPSTVNVVAHLDQSDHEKCPHPQRLADLGPNWQFYRFAVGIKKEFSEAYVPYLHLIPYSLSEDSYNQLSRYDNDWTISRGYTHNGFAPDVDRTDKMAEDEAQLALDLSLNEKAARKTYHDSWVSEFIKDLKRWALDEYKEAGRTLRDDTGPFRERHLHAHRRLIAIFEQEIDLLQQGIEDSAAASLTWPVDAYIRHSVCSGTAIITGAECVYPDIPSLTYTNHP